MLQIVLDLSKVAMTTRSCYRKTKQAHPTEGKTKGTRNKNIFPIRTQEFQTSPRS